MKIAAASTVGVLLGVLMAGAPGAVMTGAVVTTADPVTAGAAAGKSGVSCCFTRSPARPDRRYLEAAGYQHRIWGTAVGKSWRRPVQAAVPGDFLEGAAPAPPEPIAMKRRTKTNQDSLCLVVTVGDLTG